VTWVAGSALIGWKQQHHQAAALNWGPQTAMSYPEQQITSLQIPILTLSTAHGGLHVASGKALQSPAEGASPGRDVVRQLLDEIITAVVLQAPMLQDVQQDDDPTLIFHKDDSQSEFSSSKPSAARHSAITALKEGIDARCDEDNSIEAMQMALDYSADGGLLLPSSLGHTAQQGTTLQVCCTPSKSNCCTIVFLTNSLYQLSRTCVSTKVTLYTRQRPWPMLYFDLQDLTDLCSTEFAAESLAVEGPADSWLRASADLAQSFSATAAPAAAAPGSGLQLNAPGQSWEDYVNTMDNRLHTSPALPSAIQTAPAAVARAAPRAASKSGSAATAGGSPKCARGPASASPRGARSSPTGVRMSPRAQKPAATAAGASSSSPSTPASQRVGKSQATNSYAAGYAARSPSPGVHSSPPRSPTPGSTPAGTAVRSGIPSVLGSPRSPRAAALTPAAARSTRIPQQPQQQQLQAQQEQGRGLERSESLSKVGTLPTRIPSGLSSGAGSPSPLQQQQQGSTGCKPGTSPGVGGAGIGQGLDILPASAGRRSSSDNGSTSSSRRASLGGGQQRDEASAAWMSSLRSGGPSSAGSYRRTAR
jgi:hypothetical protein